jgi:hypothetical protein
MSAPEAEQHEEWFDFTLGLLIGLELGVLLTIWLLR